MEKQIQQGDVLIKAINEIPIGVKEVSKKNGSIVLAEGESTGHSHRILMEENSVDAMFYEKDGKFYLKNIHPVVVTHEEHKPVTIEPGTWEVDRVREKDWLSGMVNRVVD